MENTMRTFIAIRLPDEIRAKLGEVTIDLGLDRLNELRLARPENIHLTLKFLGETTPEQIHSLKGNLDLLTANQPSFPLTVAGLGAFPGWDRPRICIACICSSLELTNLARSLEQFTRTLGFPAENRRYSAHLTLGRFGRNSLNPEARQKISKIRDLAPAPQFGSMTVNEIVLFKSILKPGGSVYTPLSIHRFLGQE